MTGRATRLALGTLTWIVAGASMQLMQPGRAGAADDCLAGPNKQSPAGHHWFYRVDRSTKRHCWYLGDQGRAASRSARSTSKRAALFARLRRENLQAHATDDAHAELAQRRADDTLRAEDTLLTTPADQKRLVAARSTQDLPDVAAGQDLQSLVATRWPNSASVLLPPSGLTNVSLAGAMAPPDANGLAPTDPGGGASPPAMEKSEKAVAQAASNVDARAGGRGKSLYSLFWALCGALVIVALSGCATFVMTCPPHRTYQSWLSEPFDVARLKSWVDTTVSLSARYPYRFARSTRQDEADSQTV
ncbi:hypothetical protein [Bradyrhizobium sp.]|uniref:hypothetical protein n=1 Tax=Bradyrhizobium sp. TaxID=376 RepID=UPI002C8CAA0F|nr:hypothetical protein [Bradyrhizobium sp.]HWX60151.1 hypothetical protein [Bradyrhizobium sp.]